jgi:hypothetical protein
VTAQTLLQLITAEGGNIALKGDQLAYTGPPEVLGRHREDVARLKPDIIALLECTCEVIGGFRYLCHLHQDTPGGRCLAEPVPDPALEALATKAMAVFGIRPAPNYSDSAPSEASMKGANQ